LAPFFLVSVVIIFIEGKIIKGEIMNIKTNLCGVELKNPTILASGILGITAASLIRVAKEGGAGAVTTKSISLEKRKGHESPVIVEFKEGRSMLNSVGLSSPDAEEAIEELKILLKSVNVPVIASFYADTPEKFSTLAEKISKVKPHFLEANISCPNLEGKIIGSDPRIAAKVTEKIKESTEIPLIVKLTPNVSNLREIAKAVEDAGANAISAINTVGPGMMIDIKTSRPILGNKFGGLSGKCIKPIAIRCVYDISEEVSIPIVGIGGIFSGEDAVEMLMAGASAIGIGTGVLYRGIEIFKLVSNEILAFMEKEGYSSLKEIIGKAHRE
jgi:dihydroorotate dehydrogenase (NAD+) catalytic subunit